MGARSDGRTLSTENRARRFEQQVEYVLIPVQYQSPDIHKGEEVFYQGSRQIDNFSRQYYERELGAGIGPAPNFREHFGYTEPFRPFVQREDFSPQANEIPNTMPSWLPGDDYMTNFRVWEIPTPRSMKAMLASPAPDTKPFTRS